ncbi:MAG: hypothetical protein PHV21_08305 [Synergistaceae bacterium]|jgi:hypothetical protein|nr:hypothetical protein [Synergistaceae bacterium]MDD3917726.1 hypothetical protein [Synergistaceae bacterium]NLD96669.1 hypothetical protein [Synergistaceae bacterium]HOO87461.1 hypothetical protein [Synergistales bacterium]HRV97739.1 hypothetical protein [Aminobacteriaceae bacterium]
MRGIAEVDEKIENAFMSLPSEDKSAVISHGAAIRLSELNKRAFLAREKVRSFEEKYAVKLPEIEKTGLPDDAGYEMHEDYIMCSHWSDVIEKTEKQIELLRPLLEYGVLR